MGQGSTSFLLGVLALQSVPELPSAAWALALVPVALLAFRFPPLRLPAACAAGFLWALLCAQHILATGLAPELEGHDVVAEGVVVGLGAWLLAIPISYYLSRLLLASVPFNEVIKFNYTPFAPVLGLVGVMAITVLATFYPAVQAGRKTVAEILRYQ